MKRALRLTFALSMSALFLWLAFRNVDFGTVFGLLPSVKLPYVGLYVLTLVTGQVMRGLRWDVLVRPFTKLDKRALFRISNVGLMLILLLPLRLGEFARPYLTKKETGAPLSAGLGAVVVERAADGLLVTLLFFASTMWLSGTAQVPSALQAAALAALALFAAATLFIVLTLVAHDAGIKLFDRIVRPISPVVADKGGEKLRSFVQGLRSLPSARAMLSVVAWTVAYWASSAFGLYWAMCAFGWELPLVAGFVLMSVLVIGIMIPAGPGFLGTFQGAILAGLAIFGIGANEATAYGLVVYPLNILVVVGLGVPYLFFGKTQVSEIVAASEPEAA